MRYTLYPGPCSRLCSFLFRLATRIPFDPSTTDTALLYVRARVSLGFFEKATLYITDVITSVVVTETRDSSLGYRVQIDPSSFYYRQRYFKGKVNTGAEFRESDLRASTNHSSAKGKTRRTKEITS